MFIDARRRSVFIILCRPRCIIAYGVFVTLFYTRRSVYMISVLLVFLSYTFLRYVSPFYMRYILCIHSLSSDTAHMSTAVCSFLAF